MKPEEPLPPGNASKEVSALIETLHATGQRLEELTAGEVDTVMDRRGRTVLLRRAQDHMRQNQAAKQAAILNAMDAIVDAIYLVDRSSMTFIHVNDAACRMQNRTREELLALGPAGVLSISPAGPSASNSSRVLFCMRQAASLT